MERPKRESWEEFQERVGIFFNEKSEARDEDENWANFFYFSSMFCNEQGLNWRRHISLMRKTLKAIRENEGADRLL